MVMIARQAEPAAPAAHPDALDHILDRTIPAARPFSSLGWKYSYTAFNGSYSPLTVVSKGLEQRYQAQGREASANAGAPMFFRNRQYSTELGRFSRRDPELDDGNQFNSYAGMRGNSVGYVDPMGAKVEVGGVNWSSKHVDEFILEAKLSVTQGDLLRDAWAQDIKYSFVDEEQLCCLIRQEKAFAIYISGFPNSVCAGFAPCGGASNLDSGRMHGLRALDLEEYSRVRARLQGEMFLKAAHMQETPFIAGIEMSEQWKRGPTFIDSDTSIDLSFEAQGYWALVDKKLWAVAIGDQAWRTTRALGIGLVQTNLQVELIKQRFATGATLAALAEDPDYARAGREIALQAAGSGAKSALMVPYGLSKSVVRGVGWPLEVPARLLWSEEGLDYYKRGGDTEFQLATDAFAAATLLSPLKGTKVDLSLGGSSGLVSRWGRPGLQPGDWVMSGEANWLNYVLSGKWQRGFGNEFAPFSSGKSFVVPPQSVRWPTGWGVDGAIKGLVRQRRYVPPSPPPPPPPCSGGK